MENRTYSSWYSSLREGAANLFFPSVMGDDDEADLIEWLEFITLTLKRRRARRLAKPRAIDARLTDSESGKADGSA